MGTTAETAIIDVFYLRDSSWRAASVRWRILVERMFWSVGFLVVCIFLLVARVYTSVRRTFRSV